MAAQNNIQKSQDNGIITAHICVHAAFCVCGLITYIIYVTVLVASQDILAETDVQTSTVLLADIAPYFLVPLVLPFFVKRIPYIVRFVTVVVCLLVAFFNLGLVHEVNWKLISVTLASFGCGLVDSSSVGLTSYFEPSVLSWYSTGTGLGFLVAPIYYTGMTTWLCVSPNITLIILGPMSLLYLVSYYVIRKEITKREQNSTSRNEVTYTKLYSSDEVDIQEHNDTLDSTTNEALSWKTKFSLFKSLTCLIGGQCFIGFLSEYLIFQSVVTTIAFSNSPFKPRDHYQYYSMALTLGELIGRCHRSALEILKPDWLFTPKPLFLWILATIEVLHFIFLVLESWYRFLPEVGVVIFLCFTTGIVIGVAFASVLEIIRSSFEGNEREFTLTMAICFINFGILIASLVGLFFEPFLRKHCMTVLTNTANCFTRNVHAKNVC